MGLAYVCLSVEAVSGVNVGTYASPMDGLGNDQYSHLAPQLPVEGGIMVKLTCCRCARVGYDRYARTELADCAWWARCWGRILPVAGAGQAVCSDDVALGCTGQDQKS